MASWLGPLFYPKSRGLEAGHTSSIRRPARGRGEPEPVQQVRGAPLRVFGTLNSRMSSAATRPASTASLLSQQ